MLTWIRNHPQRTAGLLLSVFGSVQTSLALVQSSLPPIYSALITALFGVTVTVLAWVQKNLKDVEPTQGPPT